MRIKQGGVFVLISVFLSCAMAVFVSYIVIQVDRALAVPFGLPAESVIFRVRPRQLGGVRGEELANIVSQIAGLLQKEGTTLVYVDNDYGIGLQDPTGFFASEPLAQGAYFTAEGFNSPDAIALVRRNSPTYRMLLQGSTVVNGRVIPVRGVFGEGHPLYTPAQFFVYNFMSTTTIEGAYYFSRNSSAVREILTLLTSHGYTYREMPFIQGAGSLLRDMYLVLMTAGIVFIGFNCFFAYFVILSRHRAVFHIHRRFGATPKALLAKLLAATFPSMCLGSLLGVTIFALVFRDFLGRFTSAWVPIAFLASVAVSAFLLVTTFLSQRSGGAKEGRLC